MAARAAVERQGPEIAAYLNTIYFGNGAYGVQQAALTYFGHGASELSLAEAALLAAIPADPSRYDPLTHPRNARARRNLVLRYLFEQGKINRRDLLVTSAAPLPSGRTSVHGRGDDRRAVLRQLRQGRADRPLRRPLRLRRRAA